MSVGGAMSFFFGDCGGVDGNGTVMEACLFFSAAMDAPFLLNRFGVFPFYCGKEDFGGYGMCFPLNALR